MPVTVTRTYLEQTALGDLVRDGVQPIDGADVTRRRSVTPTFFRELYRQVGQEFHWHDRDVWTDDDIIARFAGDRVSLWELTLSGERAGFYELERHDDHSVEIALFGLLSRFAGRGLGKWLLVEAVDRAWSLGVARVWLHTCTLDSPAALPNYRARGFRPFRIEQYQTAG